MSTAYTPDKTSTRHLYYVTNLDSSRLCGSIYNTHFTLIDDKVPYINSYTAMLNLYKLSR